MSRPTRGDAGARFAATPPSRDPVPPPRHASAPDSRVAELEAQLDAALRRADEAERALAERRPGGAEGSFGMRAERLLRLAEAEARDMRAGAARDAAALLERTQADAETHRHDVEQDLITRAAAFDRESGDRAAALVAREQQLTDERETLRQEGDRLRQAAADDAERIRREATGDADRIRRVAEEAARQVRAAAAAEAERLGGVRDRTRHDLSELGRVLTGVLGEPGKAASG